MWAERKLVKIDNAKLVGRKRLWTPFGERGLEEKDDWRRKMIGGERGLEEKSKPAQCIGVKVDLR